MSQSEFDRFKAWVRDRARGCMEAEAIDHLVRGDEECGFCDLSVQGQWEAWESARTHSEQPESLKPVLRSVRFEIFQASCQLTGQNERDVYLAYFHSDDPPRPVCALTVGPLNFVEWIEVPEDHRRQGIATEVVEAVEAVCGQLSMDGVTESGVAFCEAFCERHPVAGE